MYICRMKWNLETRKLTDLKPFEKNPRVLTKKGMADLRKSIDKFGLAEPIIIQPDGTIIGGHARFQILKDKGITEIDVYVPETALNEQEYKELNIRLNKNVAGDFDFDMLTNEFSFDDLQEWGFDESELSINKHQIEEKELIPYNKSHILISYNPADHLKISSILEKLKKIEGIEIEQSTN